MNYEGCVRWLVGLLNQWVVNYEWLMNCALVGELWVGWWACWTNGFANGLPATQSWRFGTLSCYMHNSLF